MIPIPPSCAMLIAVLASVTVSIAALSSGIFNRIVRVSCVLMSTSFGNTAEYEGTSNTSSNVRYSWTDLDWPSIVFPRSRLEWINGTVIHCPLINGQDRCINTLFPQLLLNGVEQRVK